MADQYNFDYKVFYNRVQKMHRTLLARLKKLPGHSISCKTELEPEVVRYKIDIVDGGEVIVRFERWGWSGVAECHLGYHRRTSPFIMRSKTVEGFDYNKIVQAMLESVESQRFRRRYEEEQDTARKETLRQLKESGFEDSADLVLDENSSVRYRVEKDGGITMSIQLEPGGEEIGWFLKIMDMIGLSHEKETE